jgi:hypothetical protein
MEIIGSRDCKLRIATLIEAAKDELFIVTYSFSITNADLIKLYDSTTSGVSVTILTGREISTAIREQLSLLPRITIYFNRYVHSKIYVNEQEAILSSCNFSELNMPKLFECGIHMSVGIDKKQYYVLKKQVEDLLLNSECILKTQQRQIRGINLEQLLNMNK